MAKPPSPTPPTYVLREPTVSHIHKYYAIDADTGIISNKETDHVFVRPSRTMRITRTAATWTMTKLAWVLHHHAIPLDKVQLLDGNRHNLRASNLCVGAECLHLRRRVTSANLTQVRAAMDGFEVSHLALSNLLRDFAALQRDFLVLKEEVHLLRGQAAKLPPLLPIPLSPSPVLLSPATCVDPALSREARTALLLSGAAPDTVPD